MVTKKIQRWCQWRLPMVKKDLLQGSNRGGGDVVQGTGNVYGISQQQVVVVSDKTFAQNCYDIINTTHITTQVMQQTNN